MQGIIPKSQDDDGEFDDIQDDPRHNLKKNIKSEIPNDDYFIISHLKLSCLGLVLFVEAILSKTVDVQQNDL